jgi:hypothetical protein
MVQTLLLANTMIKLYTRWLAGALLLLTWTTLAGAQPNCAVPTGSGGAPVANGSQLCVQFRYDNGRVVVDRGHSVFTPSPEFTRRLTVPLAQAEQTLYAALGKLVEQTQKPYVLALRPAEFAADRAGTLNDPLTAELRSFRGSWAEYIERFDEWSAAGPERKASNEVFLDDVFSTANVDPAGTVKAGLLLPLTGSSANTPLIFNDAGNPGLQYDAEAGALSFSVADPVSDWADTNQVKFVLPDFTGRPAANDSPAQAKKREARVRELQKTLAPLSGQLFCKACIEGGLRAYYRRLGYPVRIEGLPLDMPLIGINNGQLPMTINVVEAPRIVSIILPLGAMQNGDVDKILYNLLDDGTFRNFVRNRRHIINLAPDPATPSKVAVEHLTQLGDPGPLLNLSELQIQQLLLSQTGYVVSYFPGQFSTDKSVDIVLEVQKRADVDKAGNNTPDEAPPLANEQGVVTPHEQEKEEATDFKPRADKQKEVKSHRTYVGLGVEYFPGQGTRAYGLLQRSGMRLPFGDSSVSLKAGGQQDGGAIGSLNYLADYVGFGSLHRRLMVQLSLDSDVEADRDLAPGRVDERRRGGTGRVELELFRDRGGHLLRFYAEGRHDTIGLRPDDATTPAVKQNFNTLEVGALYLYKSKERPNRLWFRLEPRLKYGLGLAAAEPSYRRAAVRGKFHQAYTSGLELDLRALFDAADRGAPPFELPSLGGAEVVRGFRRDDALGLRLWSSQNELWFPLPLSAEGGDGVKDFLREKVKLAPFFDVGGLYEPAAGSRAGLRSGAGAGLRIIFNPIVFKLDYGYGFGNAGTGGRRGKFYFSIDSNLPF